jgi:acetylornithine deacetylase/succinyl-diaminopimelate desuccinylase-like protein
MKAFNPSELKMAVDPVELLQTLIRFNTTNPPGNEKACIDYIGNLLLEYGIASQQFEEVPGRPSLVARIEGQGITAPLLAYGHIDVVTTENQDWKYPPFEGIIAEDCVWGRGAMDMKGAVAMMVTSFIQIKVSNLVPPGDIILAIVSDEEVGECGVRFLVKRHPTLFEGVKYAIGEFGGFTMYIGDKKFYPIMIAEKQICSMKVTFHGKSGHGSIPLKNEAMAKAGNFLKVINDRSLPVHITLPARLMIEALYKNMPLPKSLVLKQLLNPAFTNTALKLMGENGTAFNPLFHNSVSPTIIQGGNKVNVIPGKVELCLDGRLLPGQKPEDLIRELQALGPFDCEFEILEYDPNEGTLDLGMFNKLSSILTELDPEGTPMPLLLSGVTDARFFASLGITTYGFTPMLLGKDIDFTEMMHTQNERIPVKAVYFGTTAIYKLMNSFH